MKRLINHQIVYESSTHISVEIRNPFWSAGAKYGWGDSPGFGISQDIIKYAKEKGKKIEVRHKEDRYEITTHKIDEIKANYESFYPISSSIMLIIIPQDAFKKMIPEVETTVSIKKAFEKMPDSIRSDIRMKLGLESRQEGGRQ